MVLCLAAVVTGLSGCGTENSPAPPADAAATDSNPPAKVYTNEDLERLPPTTKLPPDDGSPGVVVAAAPEPQAQPEPRRPEPRREAAAAPAEEPVRVEAAEQRVAAASARVVELEKRLLAIRNPFLPRPELPPEEAQAWEGLDGAQRAARVEQQLAEARDELAAAEDELMSLRAKR